MTQLFSFLANIMENLFSVLAGNPRPKITYEQKSNEKEIKSLPDFQGEIDALEKQIRNLK